MIWHALAALALVNGRRLSWRDLERHSAIVPDELLPEIALLSLRAHGVDAVVKQCKSLEELKIIFKDAVALKLINDEWVLLECFDKSIAKVQIINKDDLIEKNTAEWTLSHLKNMMDGLAIGIPKNQTAPQLNNNEDSETKSQDWFWGVFSKLKAHYGDCVIAAVLINLLALAGSMFSMNVYDRIIPNAAIHSLWTLGVGVLIAAILELGLRMLRAHVLDDAGKKADLALSAVQMRQMLNLRAVDRPLASGQWVSQLREFESVRDFVSSSTLVALTDLPFAFLFIGVIAWLGGSLVWVTIAAGLLTILIGRLTQWPIKRAVHQYQFENTQKHAYLIEILERLETIESLGAQPTIQGRWERLCASTSRSAMATRMASAFTTNSAQFIQQTANVALIIYGVQLILEGHLTVGALIGCTILAGRALSPLSQIAALMTRWQHTQQAFQSVNKLMNLPKRDDPVRTYVKFPSNFESLSLKNIRFVYPKSENNILILDQLNFNEKEIITITGPVGSGKSTLLRVIAGLLNPTEGHFFINGLEVKQVSPTDWRSNVAWVGQDCVLFRGSLRENLLLAAPHVTDARLIQIIKLCGIDRMIATHPMGLDMPLGEGGQSLSGGQRQWVALARALLADSQIILMDEPTSAMDMDGEKELLERLRTEIKGRLVIIATHRPGPLVLADRLIVLDAGQVIADGPKDKVLQSIREGQISRASSKMIKIPEGIK